VSGTAAAGPVARRRWILAVALALVAVAAVAGGVNWWNDPKAATKDDEHYIAIARSVPEVFRHPSAGRVQATVDRSGRLAVDFRFPDERVRVFIHPRTEQVEEVVRFAD
jgi:hypothetical protein